MTTTGFGYGTRPVYLDRAIYTTITVMTILIVYDGWQTLKLRAAVGVILGPVLAIFVAHVFSASLARQAELRRRPGRSEQMRIIRTESRFLLLAAPALTLLIILTVAGVSLSHSIQAVIFLEGASLGFWGFVAGHRGGAYWLAARPNGSLRPDPRPPSPRAPGIPPPRPCLPSSVTRLQLSTCLQRWWPRPQDLRLRRSSTLQVAP
jgi:hypothetical protein